MSIDTSPAARCRVHLFGLVSFVHECLQPDIRIRC